MGQNAVVFVVRGDVVKRYPTANYYLVAQGKNGAPDPVHTVTPSFWGVLAEDTVFFGFSITVPQALGRDGGNGYFVAIEEQATEPRFGANEPGKSDKALRDLKSWGELSWGNLGIAPGAHIASLCDHVDLDGNLLLREDPWPGVVFEDGVQRPSEVPGLGVARRA